MRGMRRSQGRNAGTAVGMAHADSIASYLKQPYTRIVVPEKDGTYRGEILEFPGCIATGDSPSKTIQALEIAAAEWLDAAIERNQPIPGPVESADFSGRLVLRMPKSLHKKAARLAERDGISLNQFIVSGLAEYVGERAHSLQTQVVFHTNISNLSLDVTSNVVVSGAIVPIEQSSSWYPQIR